MLFRDLGAHVDGFIAVVAHTIVLGATPDKKVTGRKADAILAAHYASQAALKLLKPESQVNYNYFFFIFILIYSVCVNKIFLVNCFRRML